MQTWPHQTTRRSLQHPKETQLEIKSKDRGTYPQWTMSLSKMLQGRKRQRFSGSPREKAVLEIITDASERLESGTSIIDAIRRHLHAPSFAVGVLHQGRTIFTKGFEYATLETSRVPDHNTIYGTGCFTKALTATLLSLLEQSGRITMGVSCSEYRLWFRTPNSPVVEKLTWETF